AESELSERTQRVPRPPADAAKAIWRPSGETAGQGDAAPIGNAPFGGTPIVKRIGCASVEDWRKNSMAGASAATKAITATVATIQPSRSRALRRATTGAAIPDCEPPSAIHFNSSQRS